MVKMALKKQDLTERLLKAATELIVEKGLGGLKARDVADKAGCALGGLYTVFADLDALIFAVNLESFERLDVMMQGAVNGVGRAEVKLQGLVRTYLAFAKSEPQLWRAMFDHRLPEGRTYPAEHFQALERLMQHIAGPLKDVMPELDEAKCMTRARTLFSAFHGVIALSLYERFTGLSSDELDNELQHLLEMLLAGAAVKR